MTTANRRPVVLTIAGFDPSAGAGVLGDIKTISAFGCYGVAAVTSLTFQNTQQVFGVGHQNAEIVRRQMVALFDDFEIAAVKTGMLPTPEIVEEVASIIKTKAVPFVVIDPVLRTTSGFELTDEGAVESLSGYLFPLASLVTPNLAEAQRITGVSVRDQPGMLQAAEEILKTGARAVLVTGGDSDSCLSTDLLLDSQGTSVYTSERIRSRHTHGTGCALASALACLLAQGRSLRESVPIAKQYVSQAILSAPLLGRGHGPLNHLLPGFELQN